MDTYGKTQKEYNELHWKCTWVGCNANHTHPQIGQDGKQWACLCDEHHKLLYECQQSGDPKRILSSWVKAQGGASAAASRF